MAKYVFGTPSAEESNVLWLPSKDSSVPTGSEFETACVFLEKKLSAYFRQAKLRRDACYLRGDFWGDRTHYLEVNDPMVLTPCFFETISSWLKELGGQWRVAVPHKLVPGNAILIYASVIRFQGDNSATRLSLADVLPRYTKRK